MSDAPPSAGAESSTGSSTVDAEHLMQAIAELGTEGVWSIDAAAKTTFVNRAMAEMLGYTEHEMLGRSLFDFMDDEGRAIAQRNVARRREGIAERHDFRFVHRDGHAVFATLNTQPAEGPNGEYLGAIATVTDMTARRETDARFAALFEYSTDIITVLGPDGSWRYSSPAGTRLLGYEPGIDPEGGVFSLVHPDDVAGAIAAFADAASGTRDRDEVNMLRIRAADGSWRMFETVATNLVDDPAVGGIVLNSRDVTDRVRAEEALRDSEARFRALVQRSSDIIVVLDSEARVAYVSPAGDRIFGRAPEETVGIVGTDLVHPDDLDDATAAWAELLTTPGLTASVTLRIARADGTYRTVETIGHNSTDDPLIGGIVLNARDITDRIEAEQRAAQLLAVLERSEEVVVLSDPDGQVVYANQHARTFVGLTESDHVGDLLSLDSRVRLSEETMPFVRRHGLWTGEFMLRAGDGIEVPVLATVQAHREDGDIVLVSTIAHDITELKTAQHRLEYQATRDTLTGLPNRAHFFEAGEQALERAARHRTVTAVLFLDLDGFKAVNDSLGHATGDRVLVELAERLRLGVRGGDIVARIGGDEFCVLCERVSGPEEMRELGQRLIEAVGMPQRMDGTDVTLGASIGAALSEPGSATIESLVGNADVALYRAKHAGGGGVDVFDPAPEQRREH
jgi:diguanylate cyclase (GGDEF)-like protein/PAS domain S-box-containing protein